MKTGCRRRPPDQLASMLGGQSDGPPALRIAAPIRLVLSSIAASISAIDEDPNAPLIIKNMRSAS